MPRNLGLTLSSILLLAAGVFALLLVPVSYYDNGIVTSGGVFGLAPGVTGIEAGSFSWIVVLVFAIVWLASGIFVLRSTHLKVSFLASLTCFIVFLLIVIAFDIVPSIAVLIATAGSETTSQWINSVSLLCLALISFIPADMALLASVFGLYKLRTDKMSDAHLTKQWTVFAAYAIIALIIIYGAFNVFSIFRYSSLSPPASFNTSCAVRGSSEAGTNTILCAFDNTFNWTNWNTNDFLSHVANGTVRVNLVSEENVYIYGISCAFPLATSTPGFTYANTTIDGNPLTKGKPVAVQANVTFVATFAANITCVVAGGLIWINYTTQPPGSYMFSQVQIYESRY